MMMTGYPLRLTGTYNSHKLLDMSTGQFLCTCKGCPPCLDCRPDPTSLPNQFEALWGLFMGYLVTASSGPTAVTHPPSGMTKFVEELLRKNEFFFWTETSKKRVLRSGLDIPDEWLTPLCTLDSSFSGLPTGEHRDELVKILQPMRARLIRLELHAQPPGVSKPEVGAATIHKPDGWTKKELVAQVTTAVQGWSGTSFDRVRKAAQIEAPEPGGRGQQHRYSRRELKQLLQALESGTFHDRNRIALAWRELLGN